MEVTSHALIQGRVDEIDYDVAIFTNLTQDHLDYHITMEEYANAKQTLFNRLTKKHGRKRFKRAAFVNGQSPWSKMMVEKCSTPVYTYGLDQKDDLYATDIEMTPKGSRFTMHFKGEKAVCHTPLVGRFNIYNTLAASSACLIQDIPIKEVAKQVGTFKGVPGRLEPIPNKLGIEIYVDYAHTDDALRQVLKALRELKQGRIITIFGCGGDRDHNKRPLMGRVVQEEADFAIITQDNSRSEEPDAILGQIIKGFTDPNCYIVEKERTQAIEKGISMAKKGDVVLIAGKGHEVSQMFSTYSMEFDDRKIARSICEKLATS
jgi:UDP-N-acetylmuramoyl-L-alanyl-D-glutamate--2,6-diaminopimelate ligase